MRLLITTQVLDTSDPVLGYFVGWVRELAQRVDSIEVMCLKEGTHTLPTNVHVHSLGKERITKSSTIYGTALTRVSYTFRFISLVWKLRKEYDAVFVHMNQEYVLLAGWLWNLLGKSIYMWRNHYAGSLATDIATAFCTRVFCTSKGSYTAKYRRTVLMPVGVDTDRFHPDPHVVRTPRSILFLSRMSPSKRLDLLIAALGMLIDTGTSFVASFYGSPAKEDEAYYENLKHQAELLGLHDRVRFYPGVTNEKAADIFRTHAIFVNCSPTGMFDKTLFEAASAGAIVLAQSKDFSDAAGETLTFTDANTLAERLEAMLSLTEQAREELSASLIHTARTHSLTCLTERLVIEMTS